MAQARRSTARSKSTGARSTSRSRTTTRGPRALDRLDKSIDAAEGALKDLRSELGRGGGALVKDLDKTPEGFAQESTEPEQDGCGRPREAAEGSDHRQDDGSPRPAGWRAKDNDEEHPVELSEEVALTARTVQLAAHPPVRSR
jgi:hypothetical protein